MEEYKIHSSYLNEIKKRFGIIGNSPKINEAIDKLIQAAPTELNVLITGETGTGKEVFAKAIHGLSNRKNMPFVSVNCAAIPENLLEAELFGNEKGAYTGAVEQRIGFFETANKGTIFLDEIGEMPLLTQVKLLRVLESGEYSRLGSSVVRKLDVRVIAATNRDLEIEVQKGNFRQDLFFRLKSIHLILPPLREHPADIPLLIDYYANLTAKKLKIAYEGIVPDALTIMQSLPWPGNIRELRNLIETIVTLEKGAIITPDILRKYIPPALPAYQFRTTPNEFALTNISKNDDFNNDTALIFKTLLEIKSDINTLKIAINELINVVQKIKSNTEDLHLHHFEEVNESFINTEENLNINENEKKLIISALKKYNGNRRLASVALGISQRTLYRKLQEYGIDM